VTHLYILNMQCLTIDKALLWQQSVHVTLHLILLTLWQVNYSTCLYGNVEHSHGLAW